MDSGRLTPAERDRLRAQVLDERHPYVAEVEYEVLAEPSPPPNAETPEVKARRRQALLGELWGAGYTRWRAGSYREDDLVKARRRRELNAALDGEAHEPGQIGLSVGGPIMQAPANASGAAPSPVAAPTRTTTHLPDVSSAQGTTAHRQKKGAA